MSSSSSSKPKKNADVVLLDWKVERTTPRKAKRVPKGTPKPMVKVQHDVVVWIWGHA